MKYLTLLSATLFLLLSCTEQHDVDGAPTKSYGEKEKVTVERQEEIEEKAAKQKEELALENFK